MNQKESEEHVLRNQKDKGGRGKLRKTRKLEKKAEKTEVRGQRKLKAEGDKVKI